MSEVYVEGELAGGWLYGAGTQQRGLLLGRSLHEVVGLQGPLKPLEGEVTHREHRQQRGEENQGQSPGLTAVEGFRTRHPPIGH